MKLIVKDELRTRLNCAAQNGSVVAKDMLAQIKRNANVGEIIRGKANFFATKRKRQSGGEGYTKVKIVFTCCNKDTANENFPDRNNPQAPWFAENRTEIDPSTMVGYFKDLPTYTDEQMEYFANALCVMSRITVKVYSKMSDFVDAYSFENYTPAAQYGESTLHNSCMRHEETSRNAADFYYHFAGAKIIIAKDAEQNILGRAIVWPKTLYPIGEVDYEFSVVDRVYYSHTFVMKLIQRHAEEVGVHLRKAFNDYSHPEEFIVMNAPENLNMEKGQSISRTKLTVNVPASKWHKTGAPYLDTFSYVAIKENGMLELSNRESNRDIASCRLTSGYAERKRCYCPVCGKLHYNTDSVLCGDCEAKMMVRTLVGRAVIAKVVKYNQNYIPASLLSKGRPTPTYTLYLQIQKLYNR